MLLTPKMPPYSLTTSRSKDVQELILKPMIPSLTLPLKSLPQKPSWTLSLYSMSGLFSLLKANNEFEEEGDVGLATNGRKCGRVVQSATFGID